MYNLHSEREDLEVPSHRSSTLFEAPLLEHLKEVHSSPIMEKIPYERHSMIHEEDNPSSYNIEEIFEAFTFNIYKKEVNQKRIRNEKQNDETMKEIQEDEVLFEKTDEDLVTLATTSVALSQSSTHNVTLLNENISQEELQNTKLKDEIISLKEKMNTRRKVECYKTLLKGSILEQ